jgi:hypothetical protein
MVCGDIPQPVSQRSHETLERDLLAWFWGLCSVSTGHFRNKVLASSIETSAPTPGPKPDLSRLIPAEP